MQLNEENKRKLSFPMKNYKALFSNAMLLSLFFDKFGILPDTKKGQAYVKELLYCLDNITF
jgi:hypothetical protein